MRLFGWVLDAGSDHAHGLPCIIGAVAECEKARARKCSPRCTKVFPLAQAVQAHTLLESRATSGKLLLQVP
ncbi:MAG: zinc-binding dehydrogenase [Ktedonobacterales bacterium]